MGDPDEQVEIKGPVLTVLEGPEAVQDQRLLGRATRSPLLVKEKTMPPEAFGLALDGAVGDTELAADLAQAGAADQAMEEGLEEPRVSQPVARREGLRTEVPTTVMTQVPLHSVGVLRADKKPFLLISPRP